MSKPATNNPGAVDTAGIGKRIKPFWRGLINHGMVMIRSQPRS